MKDYRMDLKIQSTSKCRTFWKFNSNGFSFNLEDFLNFLKVISQILKPRELLKSIF